MIDSLDQVTRQQFSTFLLASESFHKLQRGLSNASKKSGNVTKLFEKKLEDFFEHATHSSPNDCVDAIVLKLKDLAANLKSKDPRGAGLIERCHENVKDLHEKNAWNCEQHLEHLHQVARFWTRKFFNAYPGGRVVLRSDITWTLEFPPSGQSLPLMSYANKGKIKVNFSLKMPGVHSMPFHQWHLCCPLMFLHEYTSHIAVRYRTFPAFDDGWMFHAIISFLQRAAWAAADDPRAFNLSEFQSGAGQNFPLSTIDDQDALGCLWIADKFEKFLDFHNRGDKFHPVTLALYAVAVSAGEAAQDRVWSLLTKLADAIDPDSSQILREELLRALDGSVDDFLRFLAT